MWCSCTGGVVVEQPKDTSCPNRRVFDIPPRFPGHLTHQALAISIGIDTSRARRYELSRSLYHRFTVSTRISKGRCLRLCAPEGVVCRSFSVGTPDQGP